MHQKPTKKLIVVIGIVVIAIIVLSIFRYKLFSISHLKPNYYVSIVNYNFKNNPNFKRDWKIANNHGKLGKNYNDSNNVYSTKQGAVIKATYNSRIHKYIAGSFQNNSIHVHPNDMVSAKIKTPLASRGFKSAFWLYNLQNNGNNKDEIDIDEVANNTLDSGIHTNTPLTPKSPPVVKHFPSNYGDTFHTYSILYTKHYISFYLDHQLTHTIHTAVPNDTFFPIFDLDVDIPNWTGKPNQKSLPNRMIVQNFKVKRLKH